MNKDGIHLSVVFSFFNEEKVLPKLLTRVRNALDKDKNISSYELIFVNDNSTDNSRDVRGRSKNSGDVILINTSRNFGYSNVTMPVSALLQVMRLFIWTLTHKIHPS